MASTTRSGTVVSALRVKDRGFPHQRRAVSGGLKICKKLNNAENYTLTLRKY